MPGEDELRCPLDDRVLERTRFEGAQVDRCPGCNGMWFDAREIWTATGDEDLQGWSSETFRFAKASHFSCPRCGGGCYQSHVGLVTLDTCRSCRGVWMDPGELDEARRQANLDRAVGRPKPSLSELLRAP